MATDLPELRSFHESISHGNARLYRGHFDTAAIDFKAAQDMAFSDSELGASHFGEGLAYLCAGLRGDDLSGTGVEGYLSLAIGRVQHSTSFYERAMSDGDQAAPGQLMRCQVLAGRIAFARALDSENLRGAYESEEISRAQRYFGDVIEGADSIAKVEALGDRALLLALYGANEYDVCVAVNDAHAAAASLPKTKSNELVPDLSSLRRLPMRLQIVQRAVAASVILNHVPKFDPDKPYERNSPRNFGRWLAFKSM